MTFSDPGCGLTDDEFVSFPLADYVTCYCRLDLTGLIEKALTPSDYLSMVVAVEVVHGVNRLTKLYVTCN